MGLIDSIKTILEVSKGIANLDPKQALLGVVDDLSDAQKKIAELEAENRTLKEHLEIRATTRFEDNAIWTNDNRGPFCSNCLDARRKLVHLIVKTNGYRSCPNCQNAPQTKEFENRRDNASRQQHENLRKRWEP